MSLLTDVINFVTKVPASLFTLILKAGSHVTKGQTPIFPEKISFPSLSNFGQPITTKNITFPI